MTFRHPRAVLKKAYHAGLEFLRQPKTFVTTVLGFKATTDYDRWSRDDSLQATWDARTLLIAKYINSCESVIEFGAGAQVIRAVLPEGCQYRPADLVARSPDTLVCDLNSAYPDLPERAGVAVFSGVLEYINDLSGLFDWLFIEFDRVIFSYATLEHTPRLITRRSNGWVNDLTQDQIAQIVTQSGFRGGAVDRWRGHVIFVVTRL